MSDVKLNQATESTLFPSSAREITTTFFEILYFNFWNPSLLHSRMFRFFLRVMLLRCNTQDNLSEECVGGLLTGDYKKSHWVWVGRGLCGWPQVFREIQGKKGVPVFTLGDSQNDHSPFDSVVFPEKFPLWFWKKVILATTSSLRAFQQYAIFFRARPTSGKNWEGHHRLKEGIFTGG